MIWFFTSILVSLASAQINFKSLPCTIIMQVSGTFYAVVPALVMVMFVYGGAKYAYSADDAGGRKQGKTICIHAIIGGIIFALVWVVLSSLQASWWGSC